jgi:hypothetical protein
VVDDGRVVIMGEGLHILRKGFLDGLGDGDGILRMLERIHEIGGSNGGVHFLLVFIGGLQSVHAIWQTFILFLPIPSQIILLPIGPLILPHYSSRPWVILVGLACRGILGLFAGLVVGTAFKEIRETSLAALTFFRNKVISIDIGKSGLLISLGMTLILNSLLRILSAIEFAKLLGPSDFHGLRDRVGGILTH